mmetsp:Transcript_7792/g.14151  ORF Transcript_7792/g.14151 Transcript_7792/m.14151 type:complete len:391 (-) Transcript_7792:118-1290(-)
MAFIICSIKFGSELRNDFDHVDRRAKNCRRSHRASNTSVSMVVSAKESGELVEWLKLSREISRVKKPDTLTDPDSVFFSASDDNLRIHAKVRRSHSSTHIPREGTVLLHGLCSGTHTFKHVLQSVADVSGRRTLAFDRPPFGLSSRPTKKQSAKIKKIDDQDPYSLRYGANLTGQLMRKLKMERGIIVAHSLGATSALEFLMREPEKVSGIVLIAPSARFQATSSRLLRDDVRRLVRLPVIGRRLIYKALSPLALSAERFDQAMQRNYHMPELMYSEEFVRSYLRPMLSPDWIRGVQSAIHALEEYDYVQILSNIKLSADLPILIIAGQHDKVIARQEISDLSEALSRAGASVSVHVVPNCGHNPHEERPSSFMRLFSDWIENSGLTARP